MSQKFIAQALVALTSLIALLALITGPAAYAGARPVAATTSHHLSAPDAFSGAATMCKGSTQDNYCIQDDGCSSSNGNSIIISDYYVDCAVIFHFKSIGKVSGSRGWPFTQGSGLNNKWDGHEVSEIIWPNWAYPNTNTDIGASDSYKRAVLRPISGETYVVQDYISGPNYKLISVRSSDHFGKTMYFAATDCRGCDVTFSTSGNEWRIYH